ncbi:hypothetical protein Bpfe_029667, partial [Biomphalaria pfeifferi]
MSTLVVRAACFETPRRQGKNLMTHCSRPGSEPDNVKTSSWNCLSPPKSIFNYSVTAKRDTMSARPLIRT